jgi:hypothetical protein
MLDEFFVHRTFGSRVIVERCVPQFEKVSDATMVPVRELFRLYSFLKGFNFYGSAVFV